MARVKSITYGRSVLVSTAQYENVRVTKEIVVELDKGDDEHEVECNLVDAVCSDMAQEILEIKGVSDKDSRKVVKQVKRDLQEKRDNVLRRYGLVGY